MKTIIYILLKINLSLILTLKMTQAMNKPISDQQDSSHKVKLIFEAFQGVGISPSFAYTHQDEVDVFVSLPPNFIKFVNTKNDIPTSRFHNPQKKNFPLHHCDLTTESKQDKGHNYFCYSIKLDHYRPIQPTIALSLWGYWESETKRIFITPESAIFHIDISKMDTHNRRLKLGLGGLVSEGMKDGFYVVAPEAIDQIDWRKNDEILSLFKTRTRYEFSGFVK